MTINHLDSPRVDTSKEINQLSAKLEIIQHAMSNLNKAASILNSQSNISASIISDIVQIQLQYIRSFQQNEIKNLKKLKAECENEIERVGNLYWQNLSYLSQDLQTTREEFLGKWKSKTIEHFVLKGLDSEGDLEPYANILRQKMDRLPHGEELHLDGLEHEAALKRRYDELQEKKKGLQQALDVNDVFVAAQVGDLEFIKKKAPIFGKEKFYNKLDDRGFAMLHIAAYAQQTQVVDYLLEKKANPEISDRFGDKPLHWAAAIGANEVALVLLENNPPADPNARGKRGMVPLHRSTFNGHQQLTQTLLNFRADPNAITEGGDTPIREAIGRNDLQMVGLMLRNSAAKVDQKDLEIAEAGRHTGIINMIRRRLRLPIQGMEEIRKIPNSEIVLGEPIAQGSFGAVHKGTWNGAEVAIKLIKQQPDPESDTGIYLREEMEKEAVMMALLDHNNTVQFHGVLSDQLGFVMEYVPGGDLYHQIPERVRTTWNWQQILSFGQQMAQGLEFLHSKKIVHRDFKSLNVLVRANNEAVITDFGISKLRQYEMTMTEGVGSPAWMAPEQFLGTNYSYPVDVYALGMILWEILTTERPFKDLEHPAQVMFRITDGKAGENIDPTVIPPALGGILEWCWKSADERPSPHEVFDALRNVDNEQLEGFDRPIG